MVDGGELVVEHQTHHVETRDERKVKIFTVDAKDSVGCIVGEMAKELHKPEQGVFQWLKNGQMFVGRNTGSDLVIVSNDPKSLGWVGVYRGDSSGRLYESNLYKTRDELLTTGFTFLSIHEFIEGEGL